MSKLLNVAKVFTPVITEVLEGLEAGLKMKEAKDMVKAAEQVAERSLSGFGVVVLTKSWDYYGVLTCSATKAAKIRSKAGFMEALQAILDDLQALEYGMMAEQALEEQAIAEQEAEAELNDCPFDADVEADEDVSELHDIEDTTPEPKTTDTPIATDALSVLDTPIAVIDGSTEESKQFVAVSRQAEIEQEIKHNLEVASNAYLTIGKLLEEAREDFVNQKEFLVWALLNFGFKKSHVYRLMKVSKVLGDVQEMQGLPLQTLTLIAGIDAEELKEEAARLAAQNKLDKEEAKRLADEDKGVSTEPKDEPKDEPQVDLDPIEETNPAFDMGISASDRAQVAESEAVAALTAQLDKLLKLNEELAKKLEAATAPKRVQVLPMLPHFSSDCLETRLGLAVGATVKEVRNAYRNTVKHYTEAANKEAYTLLTEAKDTLTA